MAENNLDYCKPVRKPCDTAFTKLMRCVQCDTRRILVVDDNVSIHDDFRKVLLGIAREKDLSASEAELFGEALEPSELDLHYEIAHAYQGKEGLEKVEIALQENRPFDMAFVDMRMPPGWDGLETIEHLWAVDPDLQIVICSAYSDYPLSEIRKRLGVNDKLLILKKPFENSEVCQLAAALTEKRRLARQASLRMDELLDIVEKRTDELRHLSRIDVLTDVYNRRGIYEKFEQIESQISHVCGIMIDIDSFKFINDNYGHLVGDDVLANVGRCIAFATPDNGIAGRMGGDEFLVLLPNADLNEGKKFAEKLRQLLSDHRFIANGQEFKVNISIGLTVQLSSGGLQHVIADADVALYRDKANGKNSIKTSSLS